MERCRRPGCSGQYGAEGFCDECGRRAPADSGASTGGAPVGGAATPAGSGSARGAGSGPPSTGYGLAGAASAGSAPFGGAPFGGASGGSVSGGSVSGGGGWISGASVSAATLGSRGGSSRSVRSRSARGRLGAGLLDMPRVPLRDPASAVLTDPQVPEGRRFCPVCEEPVGRGRAGRPGLAEGFCPRDRTPFSFIPRLRAGELVNGRYEILGCLAYGGFGWIYLARDRNISDQVSDRWVVLKGLIDTGDPDALAAAVNERRFLVEVDHPNIVKIHDFAQHPDPRTGTMIGYIVMEYVGGQSLRDLLLANRGPDGRRQPLPLPQVLAYGLEVLPALGYLHERSLLYCDFKPDNVIHAEEQLKLLDLGAVRRTDDMVSAVYGTIGYQAPEVARVGPSVASDIYTVGRTLAVLSFSFPGFSTTHAERLPDRESVPLLAREESFDRLLRRATHPDPDRRFGSAAEMAEQLRGVLREVLSAQDGVARPEPSAQFTPERRVFGVGTGALAVAARQLGGRNPDGPGSGGAPAGPGGPGPLPAASGGPGGVPAVPGWSGGVPAGPGGAGRVPAASGWSGGVPAGPAPGRPAPAPGAPNGPPLAVPGDGAVRTDGVSGAAGQLSGAEIADALPLPTMDLGDPGTAFLAALPGTGPAELVELLSAAPVRSAEVRLGLARVRIELGDLAGAASELDTLAGEDPLDWRVDWYRGLAALAGERIDAAHAAFDAVYRALPGEPAARLALAAAQERLAADDDQPALLAASSRYERVWQTDNTHVSAAFGLARTRLRLGDRAGCVRVLDQVPDSSSQHLDARVAAVRARIGAQLTQLAEADLLDASARVERLRLDVERRSWLAAEMLETALGWVRADRIGSGRVLGHPLTERGLRFGLEQAYRALGRLAPDEQTRIAWVDEANRVRPRTWL